MLSSNDQKFDRLSWIYDFLVQMVFGKSLKRAQCHFLSKLPSTGTVLIMGGGSGWILEEISARNPLLKITYVEASKKMIKKAANRKFLNPVNFVHGNEQMLPANTQFDVLMTPFFLDLFGPVRLLSAVSLLDQSFSRKGVWLFTDFHIPDKGFSKPFAKGLIYIMYRFFRVLCSIDARRLPEFDQAFEMANYEVQERCFFYMGAIRTLILKKIV